MNTFWRQSIAREWRRFSQSKLLIITTIVIPVGMSALYALMFWGGVLRELPVSVCDRDESSLSRQLVQMIEATPSSRVILRCASVEEGRASVMRGESHALVVIPRGFERAVLGGEHESGEAQVTAQINGAKILVASVLRRDLTTVFETLNIGIETQLLGARGIPAERGMQMAYPVAFESHLLFNPYGSYAYYLLPVLLQLLLVIQVSVVTVYVVGSELREGTAGEWIATAGGDIWRAVSTKLLPYLLIFSIVSFFINTLLYRYLGLPFDGEAGRVVMLILGNLFLIAGYMALSVTILAVSANRRLALSIAGGLATASMSLCGLTFPSLAMFPAIRWLAQIFPLTHYVDLFVEQSMRGAPATRSLGDLAAMGTVILVAFLFLPRLKRITTDPKYYYKS